MEPEDLGGKQQNVQEWSECGGFEGEQLFIVYVSARHWVWFVIYPMWRIGTLSLPVTQDVLGTLVPLLL